MSAAEATRIDVQPATPREVAAAGSAPPAAPKEIHAPAEKTWGPYEQRHIDASIQIQAHLRGYQARKRIATMYRAEACSDDAPLCPVDCGLGQYAEVHDNMPYIRDDKRYDVRDKTAKQALLQIGLPRHQVSGYGFDYKRLSNNALKKVREDHNVLPYGVKKQMKWIHLFLADGKKSSSSNRENYLLGQFDCVAVPVRADYDLEFEPIQTVSEKQKKKKDRGGFGGQHSGPYYGGAYYGGSHFDSKIEPPPDCDSANGFAGWFWVLHAAAPNIGESAQAEDFQAYSKEAAEVPNPSAGGYACFKPFWRQRELDEDLYIRDMARLWRLTLSHMGSMKVDDAIYFPFGMGAFLRCLGQCDPRYDKPEKMRQLRRRVADELMSAIADICVGSSDGPHRVHLCLVCASPESIQNHNCFIEAAADRAKRCPGLVNVLLLRRNVDSFQLAHELATSSKQALKVCILNGANRKLFGNHWFQSGARQAIDENLHRRSSSMARAALLLNFDTQPRPRNDTELHSTVAFFKTLVPDDMEEGAPQINAKGSPQIKAKAGTAADGVVATGVGATAKPGSSGGAGAADASGSATQDHTTSAPAGTAVGADKTSADKAAEAWPAGDKDKKDKQEKSDATKGRGWCCCGRSKKPSPNAVAPVQQSQHGHVPQSSQTHAAGTVKPGIR